MFCCRELFTSREREFAWKLRWAVMRSTSSVVRSTLDCSSADDLMEPNVPEFGVPGKASPESRDWRQEVSPTWASPRIFPAWRKKR